MAAVPITAMAAGAATVVGPRRRQRVEAGGRPRAHVLVQRGDRGRPVPEGGNLADHEHALPPLHLRPDLEELVARTDDALGRDAQPAEVEALQLGPHGPHVGAAGHQLGLAPLEGGDVVAGHAAGRMAGRGLEQDRGLAVDRRLQEVAVTAPVWTASAVMT
jgi:hypothetical protein